jgi:hypothetical protein
MNGEMTKLAMMTTGRRIFALALSAGMDSTMIAPMPNSTAFTIDKMRIEMLARVLILPPPSASF